jgi:hypothetical protein
VAFAGHSLGRPGWQVRSGAGAAHPRRAALIKTQELVFERFLMTGEYFVVVGASILKKIIFITGKFP